jgi:DNA-directed RNA polymerase
MSIKPRFNAALATSIVLAKVGNPQREEELQTSKELFCVAEEDQVPLTSLLLKSFKNLIAHRFTHHSSLDKNEMNSIAKAIFSSEKQLLPRGIDIAKRLYTKSNHPNIKAGDLCIALIQDIEMEDERVQGLCCRAVPEYLDRGR